MVVAVYVGFKLIPVTRVKTIDRYLGALERLEAETLRFTLAISLSSSWF